MSSSSGSRSGRGRGIGRGSDLAVAADREQDRGDVVVAAAVVRRLDQRVRGGVEVGAVAIEDLGDRVGVDHRREAVGAEQEDVAGRAPRRVKTSTSTSASVPSARVITERCGCTAASSGDSSPRRTSSATSEWSSVSCSSVAVAQQVGARVADVADRDLAVALTASPPSSSSPSPRPRRRRRRARARAGSRP